MYLHQSTNDNYIKWRIQRPERRNGLGLSIGQELLEALTQLDKVLDNRQEIRALIISAQASPAKHGQIWIAGGDLKELSLLTTKAEGRAYALLFQNICHGIEQLPIPVIFAVDGMVIGGGIEFMLAGDIRVATNHSSFLFKQTRVGLATGYGGSTRLTAAVGQSRALSWLLQGSTINCQTALDTGLIQHACPEDQLEKTYLEIVENICRSPYEAIRGQKRMLRPKATETFARELDLFEELWMNPDHAKFLRAFNKKSP